MESYKDLHYTIYVSRFKRNTFLIQIVQGRCLSWSCCVSTFTNFNKEDIRGIIQRPFLHNLYKEQYSRIRQTPSLHKLYKDEFSRFKEKTFSKQIVQGRCLVLYFSFHKLYKEAVRSVRSDGNYDTKQSV